MTTLSLLLGVLAFCVLGHTQQVEVRNGVVELTLEPQITGGFLMAITEGENRKVLGQIGRTIYSVFTSEEIDGGVLIKSGAVNLTVLTLYDEAADARGIKIKWDTEELTRFEDCFDFGNNQWYGGPMQENQIYPIQNANLTYSPYVTKEEDNANIVERYWLNSAGQYIYVHPQVPLFVDYNHINPNHICFGAQIAEPYSSRRVHTELSYDIWLLSDTKSAHKHAVTYYLGQPSGVPDFRMVQHPIWSTWAQYSYDVSGQKVIDFANEIREYGFNDSQLEIDDLWETCYGSLEVDTNKFPNLTHLVEEVKSLGFRVTIWLHPFINGNCEPWYSEALNNGYLVLNEDGSPDASWWNNNGTAPGLIDFTNPQASGWWSNRVRNLIETHGFDSAKFDAGQSSFAPQIPVQNGNIDLHPHHIVQAFVRACAEFGDMVEVRAGFMTQDLPIFVRMVDRDSIWGLNNGLSTVITTTLQMNLNGYPFVLPDMIGGNGFNLNHEQADEPSKELFIRWVQANAFLPVMQYSYVPWNFDNETVEISKKYTELHAEYAEEIYSVMQEAVKNGSPVNPPLWWIAPTDEEALVIWDEYLLGENILVAPVINEGGRSRNIYLPAGIWYEEGDSDRAHVGPIWLKNHPAPLNYLPYFVRDRKSTPNSATIIKLSFSLIVMALALFVA